MLRLTDVILDCPDAMALAGFYADVTGLPVKPSSTPQWAGIDLGGLELAFNPVEDYRAPHWPRAAPARTTTFCRPGGRFSCRTS
jgi:hypothetical protein